MVAYAYAARYPDKTEKLVVHGRTGSRNSALGLIVRLPALWHFDFGGPDAERLVAGVSASTSTASGTNSRVTARK